jgi:hypothetical protein
MTAGASVAFALLRLPRGSERPTDEQFRAALRKDREQLHMPPLAGDWDLQIAGPYAVHVDGSDLDEWVAWER